MVRWRSVEGEGKRFRCPFLFVCCCDVKGISYLLVALARIIVPVPVGAF